MIDALTLGSPTSAAVMTNCPATEVVTPAVLHDREVTTGVAIVIEVGLIVKVTGTSELIVSATPGSIDRKPLPVGRTVMLPSLSVRTRLRPACWHETSRPCRSRMLPLDCSLARKTDKPSPSRHCISLLLGMSEKTSVFVAGIHALVLQLKNEGREVEAVELHSAPYPGADPSRFAESLEQVLEWEWGATRLLVEHCDAPRPGGTPEKGFLPFGEEVDVLRSLREQAGGRVGLVINWARSVIETRDRDTAVEHIAHAREAGVLAGLIFSGCSPEETEFGYPWIDAHLPPVEVEGAPSSSLLNRAEISRCNKAAGNVPMHGFKIGLPRQGLSVEERVERLRQMCALVEGDLPG